MQIKDLKANALNPRTISAEARSGLKQSLDTYGDMGGIVFNRLTGNLVGGHQRVSTLPTTAEIVYILQRDRPTPVGTIAEGYIEHNGERLTYREVQWDEQKEIEALLAANAHGGEWDQEKLKLIPMQMPTLNFELAGMPELKPLRITATPVKNPKEESDEAYAARTSNTGEERVPTVSEELAAANPPPASATDVLEKTEEKMNIVGKRFMIVIDCRDQAHKDQIRGAIEEIVVAGEGKIF